MSDEINAKLEMTWNPEASASPARCEIGDGLHTPWAINHHGGRIKNSLGHHIKGIGREVAPAVAAHIVECVNSQSELASLRSERDQLKAQRDEAIKWLKNFIPILPLGCACGPKCKCNICFAKELIAASESSP